MEPQLFAITVLVIYFNSVSESFKKQYDPKTGYKAIPLALQQPKISDAVF
jgi:hypothetical protein